MRGREAHVGKEQNKTSLVATPLSRVHLQVKNQGRVRSCRPRGRTAGAAPDQAGGPVSPGNYGGRCPRATSRGLPGVVAAPRLSLLLLLVRNPLACAEGAGAGGGVSKCRRSTNSVPRASQRSPGHRLCRGNGWCPAGHGQGTAGHPAKRHIRILMSETPRTVPASTLQMRK